MRYEYVGRDALIEAAIQLVSPPVSAAVLSRECLAVRGERLALVKLLVGPRDGAPGFESDLLTVTELDPDGRLRSRVIFDADDLDGAFAELEERIRGKGN